MIISDIKYLEFSGIPKSPLTNSKSTIDKREGIVVKIASSINGVGYGEASPLTGFSKEKYEDILNSIQHLKYLISKSKKLELEQLLYEVRPFPSLVFAIESAIQSIKLSSASHKKKNIAIPINEVIGIKSLDETLNIIEDSKYFGINTFKLKIGRPNFDDDFSIIKNISVRHPEINLRLDVNSYWNYEESLHNIERLKNFNIEYIEQPVENLNTLFDLAKVSPLPIAPDESLQTVDDAISAIENPDIKVIVIKPSMFGFNNAVKLIHLANEKNVTTIISSLFEGVIGKLSNIYLASLCNHTSAHGLMPDVVCDEISSSINMTLENGLLTINDAQNIPQFEFMKEFI